MDGVAEHDSNNPITAAVSLAPIPTGTEICKLTSDAGNGSRTGVDERMGTITVRNGTSRWYLNLNCCNHIIII